LVLLILFSGNKFCDSFYNQLLVFIVKTFSLRGKKLMYSMSLNIYRLALWSMKNSC